MRTLKAQELAQKTLKTIGLGSLGLKRPEECFINDIFFIMLIRAMMCKEETIIIEYPESVLESLNDIVKVMDTMALLRSSKKILFLDLQNNENYYKGTQCTIIK